MGNEIADSSYKKFRSYEVLVLEFNLVSECVR